MLETSESESYDPDNEPTGIRHMRYIEWRLRHLSLEGFEEGKCVDRAHYVRKDHELDKDGRCIFCDKVIES